MMKTQNVWTDNIKLGQEFGAAGKRAEVVVQRCIVCGMFYLCDAVSWQ